MTNSLFISLRFLVAVDCHPGLTQAPAFGKWIWSVPFLIGIITIILCPLHLPMNWCFPAVNYQFPAETTSFPHFLSKLTQAKFQLHPPWPALGCTKSQDCVARNPIGSKFRSSHLFQKFLVTVG